MTETATAQTLHPVVTCAGPWDAPHDQLRLLPLTARCPARRLRASRRQWQDKRATCAPRLEMRPL